MTTPASQPTALLLVLSSLPNLLLASPQLVTDLHPELIKQLSHSRPVVRRATILLLGKLWSTAPSIAPVSIDVMVQKLREKLTDEDMAVVVATVNVLLEIAASFSDEDNMTLLSLAPDMFELLTTSSNNWMLIKLIKIVRHSCPRIHVRSSQLDAVYTVDPS